MLTESELFFEQLFGNRFELIERRRFVQRGAGSPGLHLWANLKRKSPIAKQGSKNKRIMRPVRATDSLRIIPHEFDSHEIGKSMSEDAGESLIRSFASPIVGSESIQVSDEVATPQVGDHRI